MNLFGFNTKAKQAIEVKDASFETIMRLFASQQGTYGGITPDSCMKSPTVHAIVTAISRRIASTPLHVYECTESNGKETKKKLPNHPIAKLLKQPNEWQSRYDFWQDATSTFVRHGRFIAILGRGSTGPIRRLYPVNPSDVHITQDPQTFDLLFKKNTQEWDFSKVLYVRGPARDFINGDSPVKDVSTTIALEIASEEFGATFFHNGAVPLMMFGYIQGMKGFKTPEDQNKFIDDFQKAFSNEKRHRAFLLPFGVEVKNPIPVENNKAQFIETRQHQRTVIAGAFGVPPQFVGDLSNGTYNNVEQQSEDFTLNVIMPVVTAFESAMERDLLTDKDRNSGIKIRFNLDAEMRASFLDRQNGLQIQLQNGIITPNEWRETEGKIPRTDPGGDEYQQSVQTQQKPTQPQDATQQQSNNGATQDATTSINNQPAN